MNTALPYTYIHTYTRRAVLPDESSLLLMGMDCSSSSGLNPSHTSMVSFSWTPLRARTASMWEAPNSDCALTSRIRWPTTRRPSLAAAPPGITCERQGRGGDERGGDRKLLNQHNFIQECMYSYGVRSASHVTVTWQHANHSCIYIRTYVRTYQGSREGKWGSCQLRTGLSNAEGHQSFQAVLSGGSLRGQAPWGAASGRCPAHNRQTRTGAMYACAYMYVCTYIRQENSEIMNLSTYIHSYVNRYLYTVCTILCMYLHTYARTDIQYTCT